MTDNLKRTKVGSVISLSGDKSRVALIQRTVKHELLGKIMKRSTKIASMMKKMFHQSGIR